MINKIGFINGSPKGDKNSCSKLIIDYIFSKVQDGSMESTIINAVKLSPSSKPASFDALLTCDVIVVVSPLYVDCLPAPLLECLRNLDQYKKSQALNPAKPAALYAVINCGFIGGEQNHIALDILNNFAKSAGFNFMGGIGLGSGEMFKATMSSIPTESSIQKPIYNGLTELLTCIKDKSPLPEPKKQLYLSQGFSKRNFILMANMGWLPQSGWKLKKIYSKPYLKKLK